MTIREAMKTPLREVTIVVSMILLLLTVYLCLSLIEKKKRGKLALSAIGTALVNTALFYLLLDCVFHYGEPDRPRTLPAPVEAFGRLPVLALIVIEVLSAAYFVWAFRVLARFRDAHLTPLSVKEAIDLLPAGVALADQDGNVVFANLTMNRISRALTGQVLTNLAPILAFGETRTFRAAYPDGSRVWQFTADMIAEGDRTYRRLIAADITELAAINDALRAKNEKLKEINRRLDIYNRNAERMIISQELLNARMQVHNETGHILLASRHYMDHPGSIDEAEFLRTLRFTNAHLLNEYEADDTERDALSEAIEMASSIGVKVLLNGMIPEDGAPRVILAAAISECATNTRKHADGDRLTVTTEADGAWVSFTLTGNGKPADKPINETGGLASLRRLAENAGGSMEITASPDFTLTLRVPATSPEDSEPTGNGSRG